MARLRHNIAANFTGQGAIALIQLAITPVYVAALGIEAYGLLGFQLTLQALAQVLDFGLSPTVNRELARFSVTREHGGARDFVRTLELGYWLIGGVAGAAVFVAAPYLSRHWLQGATLQAGVVRHAIEVMALLIAIQWPLTFYQGGLLGLQRHTALNTIKVAAASLSAAGGYLVVTRVSPTITALLWWQCATGALHVALTTIVLWRSLPSAHRASRVTLDAIRHVRGFAGGMTVITITSILLSQLDRIILSRVLPLQQYGYYVLAGMICSGLALIMRPVFTSVFPRFSALLASGNCPSLQHLYRASWQLSVILIAPCALVIALFPGDVLFLWTRDATLARSAAPLVTFLAIGTALNCFMVVPYALQVASGWTSLSVKLNVVLTLIAAPAIIWAAQRHGAIGASTVWPAIMALYVVVGLPIIHRRLVPDLGWQWVVREVVRPVLASVVLVALCRILFRPTHDLLVVALHVAMALVAGAGPVLLMSERLKDEIRQYTSLASTAPSKAP